MPRSSKRPRASQAAGEARREAWRWFGGFWVWLASIGAAGALIGALAVFWLQGRADAKAFGQYPSIYCTTAGGAFADQRMEADTASSWFRHRHSQPGNDGSRAGLDRDFQPKRLGDLHHRGQRRVPIPG